MESVIQEQRASEKGLRRAKQVSRAPPRKAACREHNLGRALLGERRILEKGGLLRNLAKLELSGSQGSRDHLNTKTST